MTFPNTALKNTLPLLFALLTTAGCVSIGQRPDLAAETAVQASPQPATVCAEQPIHDHERDRQLAQLQLRLLAREAEIGRIQADLDENRKRLDDAVLEVVRSKAKMGSLGSRAEAATALSESELMLGSLRRERSTSHSDLNAAEQMLALGNREFREGNFGGAFYLASSARTSLGMVTARQRSALPPAAEAGPETRFAVPIKFQFVARGNIRESPRIDSRILRVSEKGTHTLGISHRDRWVLVELEDGQRGWAFHDLLGAR